MDTFDLDAGTGLALDVTLSDSLGQPYVDRYDDATPIYAEFWAGGEQATLFDAAASWTDAAAGLASLEILPAQAVDLPAGRYRGRLVVVDASLGSVVAYEFAIDLRESPGTAEPPKAYCNFADLMDHGRSWLRPLQAEDDQAGFAEYRGKARAWLDDLIVSRWVGTSEGVWGYANYGYPFVGMATNYIRSLLDADGLDAQPHVVEATAKMALAMICEAQLAPGEGGDRYATLARMYRTQANARAYSSPMEIADGHGNLIGRLNLGHGTLG